MIFESVFIFMNFKNRRMLNDTVRVDLATNAENKLTANENHLQLRQ